MTPKTDREAFSIANLHPHMVRPVTALIKALDAYVFPLDGAKGCFRAFEGFRHPERQYHLFARGKVTKSRPWESAHQYGLAVDFAVKVVEGDLLNGWLWPDDAPWMELERLANRQGLHIPIHWDKGHVVHPSWGLIRNALDRDEPIYEWNWLA